MPHPDPLVTVDWLKKHLDDPNVKIVDGTWIPSWIAPAGTARSTYSQKHIPKAVYFDIDDICENSSTLPHMVPTEEVFSKKVGRLGIANADHIVVYDSNNYMASARIWWMFRLMGHTNVRVLDGGLNSWIERFATSTAKDCIVPEQCEFKSNFQPNLIADTVSVLTASEYTDPNQIQILDARPKGRFLGINPEPRKELPSGHIPNSLNIPHELVIRENGQFLKSNDLSKIFSKIAEKTICTCGSGVTAAVLALALARLGKFDISVYDGSWCAWAQDPMNPIATG